MLSFGEVKAQITELPPIVVQAPSNNGWVTVCTGDQYASWFGNNIAESWMGDYSESAGPELETIIRLSTKAVLDNPENTEPTANCGTVAGTRMNHAQSDIAHARLMLGLFHYKPGQILRINFNNGQSELYVYSGHASPPIPIDGSCG